MGSGKGQQKRTNSVSGSKRSAGSINLRIPTNPIRRGKNSIKYPFLIKEGFGGMPVTGKKSDEFAGVVVSDRPAPNDSGSEVILIEIVLNVNNDIRVGQIFLSGRKGITNTLVNYKLFGKDIKAALKYAQEITATRSNDIGKENVYFENDLTEEELTKRLNIYSRFSS